MRPQKKNRVSGVLIVLSGVLLLAAALVLLLQRLPGALSTAETIEPVDATYPQVERVTIEEAKAALETGQAVFVDVRGPAAFRAGRIPGSLLIPMNEFEQRWNELRPEDWIITYCT